MVRDLFARYGLKVTRSKRQTVGYDPRKRSIRLLRHESPGMHLHDLAHWLIAPREVRRMFEFGLGQAPHLWDAGPKIQALIQADQELARSRWPAYYATAEEAACELNVALAERYLGEKEASLVASDLNVAYPYPEGVDSRAYVIGYLKAVQLLNPEVIDALSHVRGSRS